jgi:membrane dipeptidase
VGKGSAHTGYRSFDYLRPGVDYRAYELATDLDRVEQEPVALTADEEGRFERLMAATVCISLHDHMEVDPLEPAETEAWIREGRIATGYAGLARSGLDAAFENFEDGVSTITSRMGWKWTDVVHDLGMRYCDWAHQGYAFRGERPEDVARAHTEGRIALVPALESATPIENELDRIDILYGLGVRMLGVVYSESNALGAGCRERSDAGLTEFGRRAVRRMNALGMIVDVSHAGDRTSLETIAESAAPVVISHSGARELWPISKCKPDDVIRACAERGGAIGIEAAPGTTMRAGGTEHTLDDVMAHFEHCVALVGIDHVTFGPDTFFGDHSASYDVFTDLLASGSEPEDDVRVPHVRGLENPGDFPNIVRWLVAHGYSDDEIAKAAGGNTLRIWEACVR